jgi:hypothetical protein
VADISVQKHAGHGSMRMTDHYTHLDERRRIAEALDVAHREAVSAGERGGWGDLGLDGHTCAVWASSSRSSSASRPFSGHIMASTHGAMSRSDNARNSMTISDRKRTAYHEAGHAVAHVALGAPFRYVTIRPRNPEVAGLVMCRNVQPLVFIALGPTRLGARMSRCFGSASLTWGNHPHLAQISPVSGVKGATDRSPDYRSGTVLPAPTSMRRGYIRPLDDEGWYRPWKK